MLARGISKEDVHLTCYANAVAAYSQSGQFNESDWLNPQPVDQRLLFEGNSVLRGQDPKVGNLEGSDALANQPIDDLLID